MRSALIASVLLLVQSILAAEWQVIAPNVMTLAFGCSAVDEDTIYASGGNDGGGAAILKSVDGGANWDSLPHDNQILYASIDASKDSSIGVAGALGFYKQVAVGSYTEDGETFNALPFVPLFSAIQSVSAKGDSDLYMVGLWMGRLIEDAQEGVISSHDAGKTLNYHPWSGETGARYGSFPSNTTWFISGGSWPAEEEKRNLDLETGYALNRRVKIFRSADGALSFKIRESFEGVDKSGYIAVIQKTTNGGETFETVFNSTGLYYLNGISCVDTESCWVVGEGDAGAYILSTSDSGKTWQEQTFLAGMSLIDIKMIDNQEGWAVGGEFLSNTFNALFVHTVDGGKTWTTANTIANAYPNALTVVNSNRAYATAFLRNGLSSILGYL